jgi:hypothetical protein
MMKFEEILKMNMIIQKNVTLSTLLRFLRISLSPLLTHSVYSVT